MKTFFLFSILLIWINACRKETQGLFLENKSGKPMYYVLNFRDMLISRYSPNPRAPSYLRIDNYMGSGRSRVFQGIQGDRILPDSSSRLLGGGIMEYCFAAPSAEVRLERAGGYISVFVFDDEFLSQHQLNEIITKQICKRKYRFSIEELRKINWKITYLP